MLAIAIGRGAGHGFGGFEGEGVDALFVIELGGREIRLVVVCFLLFDLFLGFAFGDEFGGLGRSFRRRRKFFVERADLLVGFCFGGGFLVAGFGELLGQRGGFVLGEVSDTTGAEDLGVMWMLGVFLGVLFASFGLVRRRHFRFRSGCGGKLGERFNRSSGFD